MLIILEHIFMIGIETSIGTRKLSDRFARKSPAGVKLGRTFFILF